MKKLMLVTLLLCLLAGMAVAQGPQNVFVQTVPVTMATAPVGDCRQMSFQVAYVTSTATEYICNQSTGTWAASAAAGGGTTGTGATVLQTSPTLITPVLGVATATSINKMAITAPAASSTLAVADGKTLTASNTLTLAGTDATVMTFPTTSATIARTDAANTFTGVQTMTSAALTTPVISTITNTGTETLPSATGGIPIVIACGATTGSAACANTAVGATSKVYFGNATLASNTATITLTPGYTSSSTFFCIGQDTTTRANPVQAVPASATTFTITNTTGASDAISWHCVGY